MSAHEPELSEAKLSQRLLKETINAPLTLGSGVSTILFGVSSALFLSSQWGLALVGLTCASAVTLSGYVLNRTWFKRHQSMMAIIEKVRADTINERQQMMASVRDSLTQLQHQAGLAQLAQLEKKFTTVNQVLDLQFDRDELTHKRYLTIAEQLYFGAIDNLKTLTTLLLSQSAINVPQLQQQLADERLSNEIKDAVQQRLTLYQQSQQHIDNILGRNEQVMTKLDEVTSKLSSIQTRDGLSTLNLDSAMREIKYLIERVDDYDINH